MCGTSGDDVLRVDSRANILQIHSEVSIFRNDSGVNVFLVGSGLTYSKSVGDKDDGHGVAGCNCDVSACGVVYLMDVARLAMVTRGGGAAVRLVAGSAPAAQGGEVGGNFSALRAGTQPSRNCTLTLLAQLLL
eukprot:6191359-Pleurochrysis_carterae.AAC.3